MKVVNRLAMRAAPWAIPVLSIGIFLLDLLTPVGVAIPVLYTIPLLLTVYSSRARDPIYFCLLATGLIWADLLFAPPGAPASYGMVNRALGVGVFWGVALALVQYKWAQQEFMNAEVARQQAVTGREAAVEARALSEAAATSALATRHVTEEKLLVSQLRLENIIQSAMDAIITVDEQQKIVLFNNAAKQMFGYSEDDVLGQPLDRFIPVRYRSAHHDHVAAFGRSGSTTRRMGTLGQVSGLRANGEEFPVEAAISQIAAGEKKYFTVILRDVTGRKRTEEAVRESKRQLSTLIENLPGAVYRCANTRDWTMLFVSEGIFELTGWSADDYVTKRIVKYGEQIHPDDQAQVWEKVQTALDKRKPFELVYRIIMRSGDVKWVWERGQGVLSQEGDLRYLEGFITDIGEIKRLEERLRHTERIAELGTLASGMAHEIGTPMNVILGRAEYLMDRVKEEPVRKGLQTIVAQVERITRVMNQLLSFARRKAPERCPLALKDAIDSSVEMFQERLASNRVQLETSIDESCSKVLADVDQMNQVLINLIMNAVHAMPEGGSLRIGLAPVKNMVKLTVADTGHGIPQDTINRIFEPFFTTKEFGKGTGLGLTVVKGIIEEHQGTIAVESESGKGTTFTILLPVSEAGQPQG